MGFVSEIRTHPDLVPGGRITGRCAGMQTLRPSHSTEVRHAAMARGHQVGLDGGAATAEVAAVHRDEKGQA